MSSSRSSIRDGSGIRPCAGISRRESLVLIGTAAASLYPWKEFADAFPERRLSPSHRIGVSLAGAEFGAAQTDFSNTRPGRLGVDYRYPSQATIEYFTANGLGLFRIPFRWERLQPRLGQALDPDELGRLKLSVEQIGRAGGRAILDLHNYGRYSLDVDGKPRIVIVGEPIDGGVPVSEEHLGDFWRRLAKAFARNSIVVGYGLMNEPHDMAPSDWKKLSQKTVDAVRQVDRETHLIVAGDGWSNAHRWEDLHSARAWIRDPAGRFAYEAHCYFDADASGKYQLSFAEELARDGDLLDRGAKRVSHFLEWCRQNRVAGFLGEFGVPRTDPRWLEVMERFLAAVAKMNFSACYWAAGEWWGDYPLSIQPGDDYQNHAPQLKLLQQHRNRI